MPDTLELLKKLMSISSLSNQESEICEFAYQLLMDEGFNVKKYPVDEKRFNLVADLSSNPKIYLQAHLDTVAPYIEQQEDSQFIYGRGACDAKGSAAAMITAAIDAKNKGHKNFGLIFTVGEEDLLDGAKKISKELEIPFVIVGEPTSLDIVNEHFGLLIIKVTAKGKAAHSSRPEEGINAIEILLEFINKVKSLEIHPETLMSLNIINGGVADNVIPDSASTTYSFRISPKDSNDYFQIFSGFINENLKLEKVFDVKSVATQILKELDFIKERRGVRYFTELSMFGKGVVIGPGDIKYAHGPDEKVSKEEVLRAVEIYSQILENFSAKA